MLSFPVSEWVCMYVTSTLICVKNPYLELHSLGWFLWKDRSIEEHELKYQRWTGPINSGSVCRRRTTTNCKTFTLHSPQAQHVVGRKDNRNFDLTSGGFLFTSCDLSKLDRQSKTIDFRQQSNHFLLFDSTIKQREAWLFPFWLHA